MKNIKSFGLIILAFFVSGNAISQVQLAIAG